jgi:trehalose 6-phosphate phosphatase
MTEAGASRKRTTGQRRTIRPRAPPPLGPDCALFLDIDGTLLELASTPERVRVDAGIATLLPALAQRLGGAVALITGRALADADRLFAGLALPIAGQHGLERRAADGSTHLHRPPLPGLRPLRREFARLAARHNGLLFEDKGATLALHYRRAPGLASHVHRTLRAQLAMTAPGTAWRLQSGKGILELKPQGRDKGTAILEYMIPPGRLPAGATTAPTNAAVTRGGG